MTLILSDIHEPTWKLSKLSVVQIQCPIFFSVLDELTSYILESMLFLLKNLRKKKWNYLANLALVKWKNLLSWNLMLNTHDILLWDQSVRSQILSFETIHNIFSLILWMLIGSKIHVEISLRERNLCTEAEKVIRDKRYFGSEQNVLFQVLFCHC